MRAAVQFLLNASSSQSVLARAVFPMVYTTVELLYYPWGDGVLTVDYESDRVTIQTPTTIVASKGLSIVGEGGGGNGGNDYTQYWRIWEESVEIPSNKKSETTITDFELISRYHLALLPRSCYNVLTCVLT